MSYFALLLGDRHCAYGRRPKVEMPENTESAWVRCLVPVLFARLVLDRGVLPECRRRRVGHCTRVTGVGQQ